MLDISKLLLNVPCAIQGHLEAFMCWTTEHLNGENLWISILCHYENVILRDSFQFFIDIQLHDVKWGFEVAVPVRLEDMMRHRRSCTSRGCGASSSFLYVSRVWCFIVVPVRPEGVMRYRRSCTSRGCAASSPFLYISGVWCIIVAPVRLESVRLHRRSCTSRGCDASSPFLYVSGVWCFIVIRVHLEGALLGHHRRPCTSIVECRRCRPQSWRSVAELYVAVECRRCRSWASLAEVLAVCWRCPRYWSRHLAVRSSSLKCTSIGEILGRSFVAARCERPCSFVSFPLVVLKKLYPWMTFPYPSEIEQKLIGCSQVCTIHWQNGLNLSLVCFHADVFNWFTNT